MKSSRWMIWLLAFSIGLNIALMTAGVVLLQNIRNQQVAMPAKVQPTHPLRFDESRLNLTPQQRKKFKELREEWSQQEAKARKEMTQRIERLGTVLLDDQSDTRTLQPLLADIRRNSDKFFIRLQQTIRKHRSLLNKNQKVVFDKVVHERFKEIQTGLVRHQQNQQRAIFRQSKNDQPTTGTLKRKKARPPAKESQTSGSQ